MSSVVLGGIGCLDYNSTIHGRPSGAELSYVNFVHKGYLVCFFLSNFCIIHGIMLSALICLYLL